MIGIAKALYKRRHSVAFATNVTFAHILESAGVDRIPCVEKDNKSFEIENWGHPLAAAIQVKHIEYALKVFSPDVLVGCHLTLGSLIAGRLHGLPVAQLGSAAYLWPSQLLLNRSPQTDVEKQAVWRHRSMLNDYNGASQLFGLPSCDANWINTPLLGDLFLLQSVPEFQGDVSSLPARVHLTGSCLWNFAQRDGDLDDWLTTSAASKRLIYVQHGKFFYFPHFWARLVDLLKDNEDVRVVADIGRMDCEVDFVPRNFYVRDYIPQERVLDHTHAVISSGTSTVVLGAVTRGVPSLLIPSGNEQPDVSERCEHAAAAISIRPDSVSNESLKNAIRNVLNSRKLRQGAQFLQQAFAQIDGHERAADLLEAVAQTRGPVLRKS